jgi:hypothetical protein
MLEVVDGHLIPLGAGAGQIEIRAMAIQIPDGGTQPSGMGDEDVDREAQSRPAIPSRQRGPGQGSLTVAHDEIIMARFVY